MDLGTLDQLNGATDGCDWAKGVKGGRRRGRSRRGRGREEGREEEREGGGEERWRRRGKMEEETIKKYKRETRE